MISFIWFVLFRLLKDEIQEIDEKIVEIKSGTADEYRVLFEELKNKKESQLKVATVLKEFQLENLKHKFQAEDQAIKQNIKVKCLCIIWKKLLFY